MKFVTVKDYALYKAVSIQSVYGKIKRGSLTIDTQSGVSMVIVKDSEAYEIEKLNGTKDDSKYIDNSMKDDSNEIINSVKLLTKLHKQGVKQYKKEIKIYKKQIKDLQKTIKKIESKKDDNYLRLEGLFNNLLNSGRVLEHKQDDIIDVPTKKSKKKKKKKSKH